jgi:hypothetical protein
LLLRGLAEAGRGREIRGEGKEEEGGTDGEIVEVV